MGMLVNNVTALVASLAKVCQPQLRAAGAWASWAAPGQPPAQLLSMLLLRRLLSYSGSPFFFQVESFVHLCTRSFNKHLGFQYVSGIILGAGERIYRENGIKSLGLWNQNSLGSNSSPPTWSLCELEQVT